MQQQVQDFETKNLQDCITQIKESYSFNRDSLPMLIDLFRKIRPEFYGNYEKAESALTELNDLLESDKRALHKFRYLVASQFKNVEILELFAESGIQTEYNFFVEFRTRLEHKLLPLQRKKESLLRVIDLIFYKNSDYKWVEKIDRTVWERFFSLINLKADFSDDGLLQRLNQSLHIVSCRIAALCADKEIKSRLKHSELLLFIEQNRLAQKIIDFTPQSGLIIEKYQMIEEDLIKNLNVCNSIIEKVQKRSAAYGTSLQQTYLLKQIKQLLYRMRIILDIANKRVPLDLDRITSFFIGLVKSENVKNNVGILIRSNIQVLAYRISEHEQNTGEHYITTDKLGFFKMLLSSMKGGIFAALMAFIKSLLHEVKMAPFWQGFSYSLNYSAGFVGIHMTGSTLATKQPAMTASAIASVMEDKKTHAPNMSELAILLSQVWRSQTASFIGNLGLAFPVALLMAFLFHLIFGGNIVEGVQAQELLDWQNPLKSKCLLYACNTGVFLYLSGLVTGFVDNKVIHDHIPERIREHPFWTRFVPQKRIDRIADYTGKNLGPIIGNIFLGFCLGMANFFGYIFGIDFDIRHITISTGQFAIGLQGLGYHVATLDFVMTIIGILFIGFFNFLVSFTLAFFTASISRKINLRQYRHLFTYMRRLIARYPFDFILPPRRKRTADDLLKRKK